MLQRGATLEQAAGVKRYLMHAPLSRNELFHYRFTRWKRNWWTLPRLNRA
jgi:hypothetical protein